MKPSKEITGFVFQEIPLDEAVNAVIAGDGNYADVKSHLLDVLPKIDQRNRENNEEPKGFAISGTWRKSIITRRSLRC